MVKVSDNSEILQGRWIVGVLSLNGANWILSMLKEWYGITNSLWARSHSNGENIDGKYHGFLLDYYIRTPTNLRITIPPYHPNGIDIKFIIPNVDDGLSGWKTFENELGKNGFHLLTTITTGLSTRPSRSFQN